MTRHTAGESSNRTHPDQPRESSDRTHPDTIRGWTDSVRRTGRLFETIARKRAILLRRYPMDTVGLVLGMFLLFLTVFVGGQSLGGPQFEESLGGLVVGFLVWVMALTAYQDIRTTITTEAQWGTLERLSMSPLGFGRVIVFEGVVHICVSVLLASLLLPLLVLVTGQRLAIDVVTVVPIALLGLLSVMGVGLAFGGLAILYKRVGSLASVFQFALLGFVAVPVETFPLTKLLPLVQANYLLGSAMRDGVSLWAMPVDDLAVLVAVALGYFLLGYACFRWFTRLARRRGVLGHY